MNRKSKLRADVSQLYCSKLLKFLTIVVEPSGNPYASKLMDHSEPRETYLLQMVHIVTASSSCKIGFKHDGDHKTSSNPTATDEMTNHV